MKRTYQPNKRKHSKVHGRMKKFLVLTAALLINTRKNNYV